MVTGIGILSRGQRCLDQDTIELHNTVMHNSPARVGQQENALWILAGYASSGHK
jgi:hypothetical protein